MSTTPAWRSGFGQCSTDLARLASLRGHAAGSFSAWVNLSRCRTWTDLRGGPPGKPDERGDLFGDLGAYHLLRVLRTQPKTLPVSWMFPFLPQAESNRKGSNGWANAAVWWQLRTERKAFLQEVWREIGYRTADLLLMHGKPFHLFTFVPGWEQSGFWYPWSVGPDFKSFLEVWKIAHDAFYRGAMKRGGVGAASIRFEFRVAGSNASGAPNLRALYPGNAHVGLIGRSLHEDPDHPWATDAGWRFETRGKGWGMDDVLEMAAARGRKMAVEEWSIHRLDEGGWKASPDPAGAMERVHAWFAANAAQLENEAYLHGTPTSLLADPTWPGATAYRRLWGEVPAASAA